MTWGAMVCAHYCRGLCTWQIGDLRQVLPKRGGHEQYLEAWSLREVSAKLVFTTWEPKLVCTTWGRKYCSKHEDLLTCTWHQGNEQCRIDQVLQFDIQYGGNLSILTSYNALQNMNLLGLHGKWNEEDALACTSVQHEPNCVYHDMGRKLAPFH